MSDNIAGGVGAMANMLGSRAGEMIGDLDALYEALTKAKAAK